MRALRPLILVALILAAWELAARSGLWSPILFPPLERIGRELFLFVTSAQGWAEIWTTLYRAFAGFGAAAVVGGLLGLAMGRSPLAAALFDPLFSGTYAVPKLALFPVFVFVFGLGSLSKVALVFLECLYPMVIITSQGARGVPKALLWSAGSMGAGRWRTLVRVVLPSTMPYVFAALRIALPVALIVVVITEMISSVDGLGYLISYSLSSLKTDRILALVVVIAALGLALDRALIGLRDRLVYWEKLDTYFA
ncbi:MAG TPA: ABC transporter permease [Burkholderiales bacterium]|nr:ABC transporter permease [Burkholderiales bacterium]